MQRYLWAFVSLLLIACGPKPPTPVLKNPDGTVLERPPEPKPEEEQQASALVSEATALQLRGDAEGARAKEDRVVELYPATLAAAGIFVKRAEEALASSAVDLALANYEKVLFYRPSYPDIATVRRRYADLLLKVGRNADAASMLKPLYQAAATPADKLLVGPKLVDALAASGQAAAALEVLVELANLPESTPEARELATERALDLIDGALVFRDAESLWRHVEGDAGWGKLHPALAYKLAKVYYHVRDFRRCEEMLQVVATRFADSPFAATARDFAARLRARFEVNTRTVGVLLPLSGKYQQYGERSLAAIKQAFVGDPSIKLAVKDSQGEPTVAAQAVDDLVVLDHVVAIIGPLFSTEAQAAAMRAEELSVPIVCLSHRDGLPEIGPYVYRTALTIKAQAEELARVAFEELGMSRFALLYPRNSYGSEFVTAFWNEVERRKGDIRGAETYEIDQTTFMEPVKKLVGRYYLLARRDYHDALLELKLKRLPPHRLQAEVERLDKRLPPIVDFDAIVIPDSSRNIGLIAPALAFEDIVLTKDPKELEKIKKATNNEKIQPVTLLGASTWNSPQTVESCERYCEGAVFVDGYFPDSPESKVRDFVAGFHEATGVDPRLSEAQAFDTAGLVRFVLTSAKPSDRAALRDALQRLPLYEGVTGKLRFDPHGDAQKNLFVLTIKDGIIKRWERALEPPRG